MRRQWIIANTISFALGTGIGLILGSLAAENFFIFVFPFAFVVLYSQQQVIKIEQWVKQSFIGVIIGTIIALIQIFALLSIVDLITNHAISIFTFAVPVLFYQSKLIKNRNWIVFSVIGLLLGVIALFLINLFIDLSFDLLIDAIEDYTKVLSWVVSGAIIGLIYGLTTSSLTMTDIDI